MKNKGSLLLKVLGGFMGVTVIAVFVTLVSIMQINAMANDAGSIYKEYLPLYQKTNQVTENAIKEVAALRGYVITGDTSFVDDFNGLDKENEALFQELIATAVSEEGKRLSKEAFDLDGAYEKIAVGEMIPAKAAGKDDEVLTIMNNKMVPAAAALSDKLKEYQAFRQNQITQILEKSVKSAEDAQQLMIILLVGFVILAIVLSLLLSRMIIKPIKILKDSLIEAEKNNDLTCQIIVKSHDEIGEMANALNSFIARIRESFQEVHNCANSVDTSVDQVNANIGRLNGYIEDISATTQELSAGMEETAASTEEVNATVEEINCAVQNIAKRAQDGANTVNEINSRASSLRKDFVHSQQEADSIFVKVEGNLRKAIEDSKEVEKINELAKAILDITGQTNLLSLNASIEAARAGDAGKGFSVVAGEIGKLAEDSTRTVNQIQVINNTVLSAVHNLSDSASAILEFVSKNVRGDYGKMLIATEDYSNDAKKVDELVTELSSTTEELLASIENITATVNEVASATNEGAQGTTNIADKASSSVDESKRTVNETQQAKGNVSVLMQAISRFKIN
jgi:methyl-accepting chemotaxis protein